MESEGYCSYKVSMMLKKLGFNEGCVSLYETAIRHNGKDLSFDDELDLKGAGRGSEIERTKGGWISNHYNTNNSSWMPKDCCSRPTHAHAARWLRDMHNFYVAPLPAPDNRWKVCCFILGKPNTLDGRINMFECTTRTLCGYDEAMEAGFIFTLGAILKGRRKVVRLTEQELQEIENKLKAEGLPL